MPDFRPWIPRRVLVTPAALRFEHGSAMVERAAQAGSEIVRLASDRLSGLPDSYRDAKSTMAVVVASPSRRRPQPIPPSADWRFDLAEGCPAHCQYCYLAGSLAGPPIIRAYANLPEILAELPPLLGQGTVTSRSTARAAEGTTFECSCYTDPLGIEHLTGSLAACITRFGAGTRRCSCASPPSSMPWRRSLASRMAGARGSGSRSTPPRRSGWKVARRAWTGGWRRCARWRRRAIRSG